MEGGWSDVTPPPRGWRRWERGLVLLRRTQEGAQMRKSYEDTGLNGHSDKQSNQAL